MAFFFAPRQARTTLVCPLCGDTFAAESAPDKCPVCNLPKAKYLEV